MRRFLVWASPLLLALLLGACTGVVGEGMPTGELRFDDAGAADGGAAVAADATAADVGPAPDARPDADRSRSEDATLATDARSPDAAPGDAAPVTPSDAGPRLVPVFVAVGKQGRRTLSCDDGRTWVNDVATDDAWPAADRYRCFSGDFVRGDGTTVSTDCDHNAWSSTSLHFADGVFLHSLGWGTPGTFFRSTDGVTWTPVYTGNTVQDLMFGDGRWVAATRASVRSDDHGLTWVDNGTIDVASGPDTIWNVRNGTYGAGTFLVTAQDGDRFDFAYSRDRGETWQRPTMADGSRVDVCGAGAPVEGDGIFVTTTWSAADQATVICRSADGARTWSSTTLPGVHLESAPLWTGRQFMVWSSGQVHSSPDGLTWTSEDTSIRGGGRGPTIGPVAVSPSGTFVAVRGGWQVWYEQQQFYRSTDGVIWDLLPDTAFYKGHPMTEISFGFAEPSGVCP